MKIKFNPFLKEVRGKIGKTVFRLCHTGEWQIASLPDMSRVKWSAAQRAHRERFRYAVEYARACMKVPELRAYYLEMAHKRGTRRPFDEAVRHHFQGRNLILEGFLDDIRKKQQNCAPSTDTAHPASAPAPESSSEQANTTAVKDNRTGRAGTASSSLATASPSAGPTATNDRWTVASFVTSDTLESYFHSVTTMYVLADETDARLPAEKQA